MDRHVAGKPLACCFMGPLALGLGLLFSGREAPLGASQANQSSETRNTNGTEVKWTLYGQGYFSRRHGLFLLENGHLHVYGELTAGAGTTGEANLQGKRGTYSHEVYDLMNGLWEKKLEEFSERPTHYLEFGSCDARDEIDLQRPDIASAFRPWPGTKMKIKNVTEFPQGYAAVVYSEFPKEKIITYGPDDRTLQVALLVRSKPGWRLVDGIEGATQPGHFCGTKTVSTTEDGAIHPIFLMFSKQGDISVLNSYILD